MWAHYILNGMHASFGKDWSICLVKFSCSHLVHETPQESQANCPRQGCRQPKYVCGQRLCHPLQYEHGKYLPTLVENYAQKNRSQNRLWFL